MTRAELVQELKGIINKDSLPAMSDEEILLRAYTTVGIVNEFGSGNDIGEWIKSYEDYPDVSLDISEKADSEILMRISEELLEIGDLETFLFVAVPGMVYNPRDFLERFEEMTGEDEPKVIVKFILQVEAEYRTNKLGTAELIQKTYEELTKIDGIVKDDEIDKESFETLYCSMKCFVLKPEYSYFKGTANELASMIASLTGKLQMSRGQVLSFLFECLKAKEYDGGADELIKNKKYNFTKLKKKTDRERLYRNVAKLILKQREENIVNYLSVAKFAGIQGKGSKETYYLQNDASVENSVVFSECLSLLYEPNAIMYIFFPSPLFVKELIDSALVKNRKIVLVYENKEWLELVSMAYGDRFEKMVTVKLEELERSTYEKEDACHVKATFFSCIGWRTISCERLRLYKIMNNITDCDLEILDLMSDKALAEDILPEEFVYQTVSLIPQGVLNSARPARKVLARVKRMGSISGVDRSEINVPVRQYSLDVIGNKQVLTLYREEALYIGQEEMVHGGACSLRRLYGEEVLRRKKTPRSRGTAVSIDFSDDIKIWVSKTKQGDKIRAEAYFCMPTEEGFKRGKIIASTKKHKLLKDESEVYKWAAEEFPYSILNERMSDKKSSVGKVNIRQEYIETSAEYYEDEQHRNITLKTLWYIYPEIDETLPSTRGILLKDTLKSDISRESVTDIDADRIERLLRQYYPNDDKVRLLGRFRVLADLVELGKNKGFCKENVLRQALNNARQCDKLFAQVRAALTKKHFTKAEVSDFYGQALREYESGKIEYIGVLLRILTGLPANVICALKWKDIVVCDELDLKYLLLTRQMTNDGKTVKGFDDLQSYLCFPCTQLMDELLEQHRKRLEDDHNTTDDLSKSLIVQASGRSHVSRKNKNVTPQELSKLESGMIKNMGLDDVIVFVPALDNGTKETNLSLYGGDFLRENFRYWSAHAAGLSDDEIAYLIGNTPGTTVGRYYIDFTNAFSLLGMKIKLQRWNPSVRDDARKEAFEATLKKGTNIYNIDGHGCVCAYMIAEVPEGGIDMEVNSRYGVSCEIRKIKGDKQDNA